MSCIWFRELYNKYCCPCLQNNQQSNTLPRLPRDIAETLADVNISTAPTPVNNDAIINDVVINDAIIIDAIINDTIINDSPKNTYGTEPAHSVHSRKIEFSIDNDYIRKSADSIDICSPRTTVSDDILSPIKHVT